MHFRCSEVKNVNDQVPLERGEDATEIHHSLLRLFQKDAYSPFGVDKWIFFFKTGGTSVLDEAGQHKR
jgi:hypothetical protein